MGARRNRVRCKKCDDIIESKHRHDFVWCRCHAIAVDGGHDYLRRIGNLEDMEEIVDDQKVLEAPTGEEKECPHGTPMRYALNCERCIEGDPPAG